MPAYYTSTSVTLLIDGDDAWFKTLMLDSYGRARWSGWHKTDPRHWRTSGAFKRHPDSLAEAMVRLRARDDARAARSNNDST